MNRSPVQNRLLVYLRHELCTPINGMIGYSELLLEEPQIQQNAALLDDLQKIYACSKQLLSLVSTTLDPEKLETSEIEGELDRFGTKLRVELLTPLSTIMGYCEMLLEDAPAESIPDLNHLNASAQQLLILVNDIVSLAQQQLQILNEQGEAATLSVKSPAAVNFLQNATTTFVSLHRASPEKQIQDGMILVIDDSNPDLLARKLKRQGYTTVTTATSAQQALEHLKAAPCDLILLDVIMPDMNGLELLEQLKQHEAWRHIPVIMISALEEIEGAVKCIELGAEDYLQKPFDPTLLKARIGACLEKKRLRDQEILYLQQVDRLTTAAAEIEAKTFTPDSLNDLNQQQDEFGQLVRVFQKMAQEVQSRERTLVQQVNFLQAAVHKDQRVQIADELAATNHFRQNQKRGKGGRDVENLYRGSLYPSLSRFSANEEPTIQKVNLSTIAKRNRDTKKIMIHAFRGGTGKSNLTSNLAISLAKQGYRVGIIDTDLQSPGIHLLFGLEDETVTLTLNDYLSGRCALHEAAYDLSRVLPEQSEGAVYLIPASVKAGEMTRILREGYHDEKLLDGFSEISRDLSLDFLLIDSHPGIAPETLQAIAASSLLLLVLRPDYQDYQGTAVIVELARMLSVENIALIVNRALPNFDVETYRQQLETSYDVPVVGILPFSEEMMHLSSSEIFLVCYPDHPLTKVIDQISQQLIG
ncbi:response regulator [Leptolyngbya sp. NIES-2104]|uniref:response regulator n=1 Tax=Leptolyngbya sp. NIES-2104 TaxID=1552121 RepID=UPI0006EC60E5|nr:response regulator [Leptolyngbya sp. NIES-2104]GAP94309.1 cell division inhibitor [Leptolyngbya sp. NIES-2104]